MKSISTFIRIEWKNKNYILYLAMNIVAFIALAEFIKLGKESPSLYAIDFSIFVFLLFGLFWSISMLESIKNDQSINVIKTYVSYPVTPIEYVLSKTLVYLALNVISSVIGSIFALIIIGNVNFESFMLFISATFYTLFASTSLFLLTSLFSRFGLLSEIVLVFYFFFIFSAMLGLTTDNSIFITIFPYMIFFDKLLSLSLGRIPITNIIEFPVIYILFIFLTFIILKVFKWYPLFDYE